jgi:hypothetical protein
MHYFYILVIASFFLISCSARNEPEETLLPREYYRSIISNSDIGVALSNNGDDFNGIIPSIIQHEKISEAIYLTHEGETFIGVRLKPYYRLGSNGVIQEVSEMTTIATSNIIDDPRKYRMLERLSKQKQVDGVNEMWVSEWLAFKESISKEVHLKR